MTTSQANQSNPANIPNNPPQDVQPETGTRSLEEQQIRQSSPINPRVSEKPEEAPEEA